MQEMKREQGFTLVEIMASIVILSIVSLTLTTFFVQALSYSKGNQNKTIMVNLARNALFYIQKESFTDMQSYFKDPVRVSNPILDSSTLTSYEKARDSASLQAVLSPVINGISYQVSIEYEPELLNKMEDSATFPVSSHVTGAEFVQYFLPVKVTVTSTTNHQNSRDQIEVEGYIIDENIR